MINEPIDVLLVGDTTSIAVYANGEYSETLSEDLKLLAEDIRADIGITPIKIDWVGFGLDYSREPLGYSSILRSVSFGENLVLMSSEPSSFETYTELQYLMERIINRIRVVGGSHFIKSVEFKRKEIPRIMPKMTPEEVNNRFGWHKATLEGENATKPVHDNLRALYKEFATKLNDILPEGRYKSLTLTELENSAMWSHKSVAEMATKEEY